MIAFPLTGIHSYISLKIFAVFFMWVLLVQYTFKTILYLFFIFTFIFIKCISENEQGKENITDYGGLNMFNSVHVINWHTVLSHLL